MHLFFQHSITYVIVIMLIEEEEHECIRLHI